VRNESHDRDSAADANVESSIGVTSNAADEIARLSPPFRVTFIHTRKKLADLDNLCGKAVLDGIARRALYGDDSPKQIAEIRHRQIKGETETTVIEIEEIDDIGEDWQVRGIINPEKTIITLEWD
jgi:Holliday junction resolvase RusA-like endonuclease